MVATLAHWQGCALCITSGHDFAHDLNQYSKECYGVAGVQFIEHVVSNIKALRRSLREDVQAYAKELASQGGGSIDGQV
ncbi:MAG: hypothetical protein ACRCV6_04685, partial [Formosimonas sp.]